MTRRFLFLVGATLGLILVSDAAAAQPSADWIKRTKERIDLLLGPKRDSTPVPADLPNPFRSPGKAEQEVSHTPNRAPVPLSDADTLARLVATLKTNGLVQIAGVPQVIINQLAYKEGDLVAVRSGDQATYLRVIHVTPGSFTLELNKVEQTVHLK